MIWVAKSTVKKNHLDLGNQIYRLAISKILKKNHLDLGPNLKTLNPNNRVPKFF